MTVRFLHTADWQLGRRFGRFDDALSGRLSAERQDVISRIAQAATDHAATHILVAGDVWDNASPNSAVLRQPLEIMGEWPDLIWWLMPGNHDPDGPDGLWDRVEALAHNNVRCLRQAEPIEMEAGVWILPAPWQRLHHGRDLTEWMDQAQTPAKAMRIGIAHGSIKTFGTKHDGQSDGDTDAIIPPDRATRARLDYLALGDWHARTAVNRNTHYPGTPEPDRFKTGERGQVLLVEIDEPGADPVVTDVPTARYDWSVIDTKLRVDAVTEGLDQIEKAINSGLPSRNTLAEIHISGETTVSEWAAFERFIEAMSERCAYLNLRGTEAVSLKIIPEDIETLDAQGSVRQAAETLRAQRDDPTLSQSDQALASDALRILFSFAATEESAA